MLLTFTRETYTANGVEGFGDATPETWVAEAVILPADRSPNESFAANLLIQQKYRKLIIAGKNATGEPMEQDTTVFEGATWKISGYTKVAPDGGPAIIWKIWVERV